MQFWPFMTLKFLQKIHEKAKLWLLTYVGNRRFQRSQSVWKSPKMSHLNFWNLSFSTLFCSIKTLVTLFDRKLQVFKNSAKWTIFAIFTKLLSTQNVNVAGFARNVEWDFFCDFQTPCIVSSWARRKQAEIPLCVNVDSKGIILLLHMSWLREMFYGYHSVLLESYFLLLPYLHACLVMLCFWLKLSGSENLKLHSGAEDCKAMRQNQMPLKPIYEIARPIAQCRRRRQKVNAVS